MLWAKPVMLLTSYRTRNFVEEKNKCSLGQLDIQDNPPIMSPTTYHLCDRRSLWQFITNNTGYKQSIGKSCTSEFQARIEVKQGNTLKSHRWVDKWEGRLVSGNEHERFEKKKYCWQDAWGLRLVPPIRQASTRQSCTEYYLTGQERGASCIYLDLHINSTSTTWQNGSNNTTPAASVGL